MGGRRLHPLQPTLDRTQRQSERYGCRVLRLSSLPQLTHIRHGTAVPKECESAVNTVCDPTRFHPTLFAGSRGDNGPSSTFFPTRQRRTDRSAIVRTAASSSCSCSRRVTTCGDQSFISFPRSTWEASLDALRPDSTPLTLSNQPSAPRRQKQIQKLLQKSVTRTSISPSTIADRNQRPGQAMTPSLVGGFTN